MKLKLKKLEFTFLCVLLVVLGGTFYFRFPSKQPVVDVAKELGKLTQDDKDALEWFFRDLYFYGSYSYVLFGDKPMSIYSFLDIEWQPDYPQIYRHHEFFSFSINKVTRNNLMKIKGWETWKKYRAVFPSSNFIMLENHDPGYTTLVMINRHAFIKVVEENIDEFRNILGSEVTPQVVLSRCIQSQDLFKDILKCDDGLLGILLGYGTHNALLFARRHQIKGIRDAQKFALAKKTLSPSEGFKTLEEEYNNINKRLLAFDNSILDDFNPLLIALPGFVADPDHAETKKLKAKYRKQYRNTIKQYKKRDFLEVTINQFCNCS